MSRRYATTVNEQADGGDGAVGQRNAFASDIPGRSDADSKLGASGPSIFNADIESPEEIERIFKNQLQSVAATDHPDFSNGVDLNYGKAKIDSPLLKGEKSLKDYAATDDKPQYGAPNITTGDMNAPSERTDSSDLPRRNAGYGSRIPGELHEHVPAVTRDRIGSYFSNNDRRSSNGLGVSHPTRRS
jgi:hypothetical protein